MLNHKGAIMKYLTILLTELFFLFTNLAKSPLKEISFLFLYDLLILIWSFKSIKIESTTARSKHTKQVVAICGSYNSEEPPEFQCLEDRCTYFRDTTTCDKVQNNENLYVGWTVVFDELERKEVPRCKTFAHRWRENAFNWGNAAQGIF